MTWHRFQDGYDHHRGSQPLLRPTHVKRGIAFLAVTLAGFILISAFWQYLGTGTWLDFRPAAYRRDMTTLLSQVFLQPLSVFNYRWMLLVGPLVLASLFLMPVIVAILYRLGFALVFVAVVASVAHAPVLALALAAGCLLAAYTPLRSDAPFLAFLLGLVPVGAYLVVVAMLSSPIALPLHRWVPLAPFPAAILIAIAGAGAVLALARLIGYRPGVVWPVMLALLAPPMAIFFAKVGPHELDYCLIVKSLDGGEAIFKPSTVEDWASRSGGRGLDLRMQLTQAREDLAARKIELVQRCQRFLDRHPTSVHGVEMDWLTAHSQGLVIDERAFQIGLLKFRAVHSLDSEAARQAWQRLKQDYPAQPQAALAELYLGERACREGDVTSGVVLVRSALAKLDAYVAAQDKRAQSDPDERIFQPMPTLPSIAHYRDALFQARKLAWLIEENSCLHDPQSAKALAECLAVSPYEADRYARLCGLAGKYEHTPLGDNLKLAVALATPDLYERAQALILLASPGSDADAAIEANYELGELASAPALAPALGLLQNLRPPQWYYNEVTTARPNPWTDLARRRLAALASATVPRERP